MGVGESIVWVYGESMGLACPSSGHTWPHSPDGHAAKVCEPRHHDDGENNHRVSGFGRIPIKDDVMTTTMMITITTMTAMSTFQHLSV